MKPTEYEYTSQVDWEEEIKNIRWFWPHIRRDSLSSYPLAGSHSVGSSLEMIDFVIPFEFRKKTIDEIKKDYGSFYKVFEYLAAPEIFFQIHYSDGTTSIRSSIGSVFVSTYEPQKE
jgi:hypothetical protein